MRASCFCTDVHHGDAEKSRCRVRVDLKSSGLCVVACVVRSIIAQWMNLIMGQAKFLIDLTIIYSAVAKRGRGTIAMEFFQHM